MNNFPGIISDKTATIRHTKPVPKSKPSVHMPSPKKSIDSIPKAKDFDKYKAFMFKRLQEIEAILNKKST